MNRYGLFVFLEFYVVFEKGGGRKCKFRFGELFLTEVNNRTGWIVRLTCVCVCVYVKSLEGYVLKI